MTSTDERRKQMEARLAELHVRLETVEAELESHNSPDSEELAIERETDEVLEDLGLSAQEEIRAITAALERMDAGDYGYCARCGEKIEEARLDVLPYTPFCKSCAQKVAP